MRTAILALLLAACGGGSDCSPDAGTLYFCQYQTDLRIVPGFVRVTGCDGVPVVSDDYGLSAEGWDAAEQWTSDYFAHGGNPPSEEDPGCVVVSDILGREVLDYRTGEFVLVDDVGEFLNR